MASATGAAIAVADPPSASNRPARLRVLHPGNLLVSDGRLSAVIDFGDLTAGDPATDLSVAWLRLPRPARMAFRALTYGPSGWLDDYTWNRARGWALALGLAFLANSSRDAIMSAIGHAALSSVLDDASR